MNHMQSYRKQKAGIARGAIFIFVIFFFTMSFSVSTDSFAQRPIPVPIVANECGDGKDNDGDTKIDKSDPQCISGIWCENGEKTLDCKKKATGDDTGATGTGDDTGATCTNQPCIDGDSKGFPLRVKLNNPLKVDTIREAIKLFMDAVVKIAIPFIVVFFIWSGLKFILAQGNPEAIKKAKTMFWYTVIGTLLILGAWGITNAIVGTINAIAS